tara:strand:+ start:31 stop:216 length:186 start_codon:yes stop_codon:yes gene_type:complete
MMNFIIKWSGLLFCFAGFICSITALTLCAITTPSWGATLMMVAIIIFVTGQFADLLFEELK